MRVAPSIFAVAFAATSLTLAGCGSAGTSSTVPVATPTPKRVGFGSGWTLTLTNDSQNSGGPGIPVTFVLYTNCINDSPPWSYTVQPGGGSAAFTLQGINYSGSCYTQNAYGTVTLTDGFGRQLDQVAFQWVSSANSMTINCGFNTTSSPINYGWTYDYPGYAQLPTCTYQ